MTEPQIAFLAAARTATLATIAPDGSPRLVPVCFVLTLGDPPMLWTPLDEKPKDVDDVRKLARVRDIVNRSTVTLLVHRWSEDWSELGWLRVAGRAALVEPTGTVLAALRAKYPQYATHHLEERPLIQVEIERVRSWGKLG